MQGRDLMAEESPPESVLIQCAHQAPMDGIGVRPNVHSLRDARYRISVFEGLPWGKPYELETDPAELCNLWDDPGRRRPEGTPARTAPAGRSGPYRDSTGTGRPCLSLRPCPARDVWGATQIVPPPSDSPRRPHYILPE